MKKQTALTVALALALGVGAQAVASAAPYNDVPSSAKQAVDKLYKDGLLDNKSQKFGPNANVTRVEMAKLVAEAMTKLEKADDQQKAMIKKLAVEFKPELEALKADVDGAKGDINTINGRLDGVEKKLAEKQNVQFNGYVRERYESTDAFGTQNADSKFRTRFRLDMTAPLDGNFTFKGRFEYNGTDKTNGIWDNGTTNVSQAYVAGKAFGLDGVLVGRMPLFLGQGLVAGYNADDTRTGADALAVATHIDKVNIVAGTGRVKATVPAGDGPTTAVVFANLAAPVSDNLGLTASYLKNSDSTAYKTTSFGLKYTGLDKFTVTGEWGKNKAVAANNAKAYFYQVKYLGADKTQQGSYGIWAQYRDADQGFEPLGLTALDITVSQKTGGLQAVDNIKGWEFGVEYTAFKNGVLSFKYEGLKKKVGDEDRKAYIGQLELFF